MGLSGWVLFALASAAGGLVRWAITARLDRRTIGRGTLVVNVAGSLMLGVLVGWAARRSMSTTELAIAGAGFCGSLTTFSTFAVESLDTADRAGPAPALARLLLSVIGPLAAAAIGLAGAAALAG